ncbi:MAG: DUF6441 family protein [Beijerinckiaceae bacterium]|nr:DUF6441 family protein [Beijerinckiaceae bacterium]
MSQLKLIVASIEGKFSSAVREIYKPIAEAGTAAIRQAGDDVKRDARASIASAGFGSKWQNALRVDVYPKRGSSARAAAHIYHKIPYAAVFERGATIHGKPMLWIPMSHTPKRANGARLTAAAYVRTIGPLVSFNRPGKPPMLAGQIKASAKGNVTPAKLRSGKKLAAKTLTNKKLAHKKGGAGVRLIPLYTGISTVTIRRRFGIYAAINRARANLASYYLANLKG